MQIWSDFFQTSDFFKLAYLIFQNFFGDDRMKTAEVICASNPKNRDLTSEKCSDRSEKKNLNHRKSRFLGFLGFPKIDIFDGSNLFFWTDWGTFQHPKGHFFGFFTVLVHSYRSYPPRPSIHPTL